jgi:hypothetical protein
LRAACGRRPPVGQGLRRVMPGIILGIIALNFLTLPRNYSNPYLDKINIQVNNA